MKQTDRIWLASGQRFLAAKKAYLALAAACLACAAQGAALPASSLQAESRPAAQIQRQLGLPRGSANYLPAYASLTRLLYGPHGLWRHANGTLEKIPDMKPAARNPRVIKYLHAIESKMVAGTKADLLLDSLLKTLTLTGRAAVGGSRGAVYDSLNQRMDIAGLMLQKSHLDGRLGKKHSAINYLRSAILLEAQDHADTPGPRLYMRSPNESYLPDALYKPLRHMEEANLGKWEKFNAPLYLLAHPKGGLQTAAPHAAARRARLMARFSSVWKAARVDLRYRYEVLQLVNKMRMAAARSHRKPLLDSLDGLLGRWQKQITADRTLTPIDRAAILRWIKEASGQ